MKLVANTCANCRLVLGYVVAGTLQLPTLCILCAGDKEILNEWGHEIRKTEKPVREVLLKYRSTLNQLVNLDD